MIWMLSLDATCAVPLSAAMFDGSEPRARPCPRGGTAFLRHGLPRRAPYGLNSLKKRRLPVSGIVKELHGASPEDVHAGALKSSLYWSSTQPQLPVQVMATKFPCLVIDVKTGCG